MAKLNNPMRQLSKRDIHECIGIVERCRKFLNKSFPARGCFDMLYIRPYFGQAGTWNRKIYKDSQLLLYLIIKEMREYNAMLPEDKKVVYYYGYDEFFEKFEKEIPNMEGFPDLNRNEE